MTNNELFQGSDVEVVEVKISVAIKVTSAIGSVA